MGKIVSESRLAAKCRACPYVDTCDHKRMEAMACMVMDAHNGRAVEDVAMPSAETKLSHYKRDRCAEAATALSTLQAENEKLRDELERVKHALAMMWFAYVNSDKETPHSYETEAIEEAERLLGPWEECMPKYLRRGKKEE